MNDDFYKHLNGESPTGQSEKRLKENEVKEKRATELIIAEEALKSKHRLLTDIIEFLPDATLAIDKEKRVIIWNKAMEKMTSIHAAEMIGKGDHVYTIPFYGKAQLQLMDLVFLDEEEIATRYPTLTREGDSLIAEVFCPALNNNKGAWVFAKASPLHDQAGNIIGAIESIRDITKRKQAEEEILESKNFLKQMVNVISDLIFYKDTSSVYLGSNKSFAEKFIGLSEDEIIGKTDLDFVKDEELARFFRQKDKEVLKEGKTKANEETITLADGTVIEIETVKSPFFDESGKVAGLIGISRDITERKNAEREILESKNFLEILLESIPAPVFYKDINGRYLGFNRAYEDFFGKTKDELIGKSVFDISPVKLARIYHAKDVELFERLGTQTYETQVKDARGVLHDVVFYKASLTDSLGKVIGLIGTILDISKSRKAEEAMRESETKFRTLFESAYDAIFLMDQNIFIDCNQKALGLFGCTREQIIGQTPSRFSPEVQPDRRNSLEKAQEKINAAMRGQSQFFEWKHCRDDGTLFYAEVSMSIFSVANKSYIQSLVHDITERKNSEEQIKYLATHDSLTELPNRLMFTQLLNHSIQSARHHKRKLAVFFIDLDRFKIINDTKGHDAGDQLLQEIALRYKLALRAEDVVSRQGGDEFVILIEEFKELKDLKIVANIILSNTLKPIILFGEECRITASIGISVYPKDGEDEQSLMKNADIAMYYAKEEGKNNFQFYSKDIQSISTERLDIETNLRLALERNEFFLHYQAKVNFKTGMITGVEALLRWQNPCLGSVTPTQFIPVAEETGMIVAIGEWVLKTACTQNVAWQKQGLPAIPMAVNLSLRQLTDSNLIDEIKAALNDSGMEPGLLELEITESMMMGNPAKMITLLNKIKKIGVRLAIDDFGTGYSSLSQIQHFPIDTLKIDRSFISNLPENDRDNAITHAIIAMGETLGLTVVAEGVETVEQMNFLKEHDCDEMQGYFFSKPIEPDKFADLLNEYAPTT